MPIEKQKSTATQQHLFTTLACHQQYRACSQCVVLNQLNRQCILQSQQCNFRFVQWKCSGNKPVFNCDITMNASRSVAAYFSRPFFQGHCISHIQATCPRRPFLRNLLTRKQTPLIKLCLLTCIQQMKEPARQRTPLHPLLKNLHLGTLRLLLH